MKEVSYVKPRNCSDIFIGFDETTFASENSSNVLRKTKLKCEKTNHSDGPRSLKAT